MTPILEEGKQSKDAILYLSPYLRDKKSEVNKTGEISVPQEPDCDLQLPSNIPHVAEGKDQKNYRGEDSGSTTHEEPEPTVKKNKRKPRRGNATNPKDLSVDCGPNTGHTGEKQVKLTSDLKRHSRIQTSDNQPAPATTGGKGPRGSGCEVTISAKSRPYERFRIPTGGKQYRCEKCGKSFVQTSDLTKHMRVHTGEKSYLCKACWKAFKQSTALIVHMRVHTGEKPYLCKACGKAYTQSSTLYVHMRSHTGEKPYSCQTCRKSFYQKCYLTIHMRVHTGEKPYLCKTCGKAFGNRSTLTQHMSSHW